ncbi:glycosyltransferase family 57 protein [Dothidotthia symphoricarpi CBS 119687]|uniref:Glycosyltransferase family 57 protein n=1 Tax=Dothidotthia symphoricarpi CBS 119687 TaxID=1392245 RepID=A0A6A6A4Q8_9PLEO|nr:glycosyltransferase family 57 protein [Dothidotthia symphoricarpi CBS 119687]KAF2126155.1 glycosyltransferase family 57 protein [Dothidotthia symphoricarpi CBS 119687]
MAELNPSIAQCAVVATALKVLLFPAYKSTDFEVHRNWLALTHSLSIKEWYYENTSEWTLDYPPFFAYFEWLMSQAAAYIEPGMLNVKALGYDSWQTIYFQRTTVILTELVLVYALHLYVKTSKTKVTAHAAALSILLSPGLLIIDHIHFQYNGFLYGILILSMVLARNKSTVLLSGLLFAALLCLKHIYLYLAPAYFVYLLRAYCSGQQSSFPYFRVRFLNCIKLGVGIVAVFASAFGPFALWGQLEQVFRRLFPFSRGLCHAYWAPNIWAMYSFVDRVLIQLAPRLGLAVDVEAMNSVTRGLVGDTSFAVLPDIAPLVCFLLTLGAQIPVLLRLLYKPTWHTFVGAVTLCGYASFLFGWHVHEKAILLVIIPFSLIALIDRRYFGAFRPLAVAGHVSLFPLLFTAGEFPVKTVYTIFWLVLFLLIFDRLAPASPRPRIFLLDRFSFLYIALSIPLIAYCSLFHGIFFGSRYEFLPLMFTSSYSAIGVGLDAKLLVGTLSYITLPIDSSHLSRRSLRHSTIDRTTPAPTTLATSKQLELTRFFGIIYASRNRTAEECANFTQNLLRFRSELLFALTVHKRGERFELLPGLACGRLRLRASRLATLPKVLYKRKPVKFDPHPKNLDDGTEVYPIEETGEVYTEYEKFLDRRDFYDQASAVLLTRTTTLTPLQKVFTCEATGHTKYTFFEARESEVGITSVRDKDNQSVTTIQMEAAKEINSIFPDGLRSLVLHWVQFQTTSRMDDLVNKTYDHFKEHFMIRDRVSIESDNNTRRFGMITEMTSNEHLQTMFAGQSEDEAYRSFTYVIKMDDTGENVTKYKASELQRDNRVYSKLILKQFLRSTISRESWIGAPWMAKEHLVKRYSIPTTIPENKTREAIMAQKKALNASHSNGTSPPVQQPYLQNQPNGHAPNVNGHRPSLPVPGQGQPTFVNFSANPSQPQRHATAGPPMMHPPLIGPPRGFHAPPQPIHYVNGQPMHPPGYLVTNFPPQYAYVQQQHAPHPSTGPTMNQHYQTSFPHNQRPPAAHVPQPQQAQPVTKPFEPVKYPCEDLEIRIPKTEPARPTLKFLCDDTPKGAEPLPDDEKTGILMKSVGPLLCIWETLNVHDTVYMLDSFTFDDFVDAMLFSSEETECELFVEVHCSILKQIVSSSGKFQAPLPNMDDADDSDDEESSTESTPTPEPEPPVRKTRSSLRKSEVQQIVKPRTPTPELPKQIHKAAEFVAEFDWVEQCKDRNFREGGWQSSMVGLLYRLSFDPTQKSACDEILAELVPPDEEPTVDNVASNYVHLDVNLRIAALESALRLTVATETFRDQLVAAAQELTRLRKEKIEFQRKRKELADELFKLDLERRIHLPANTPASPTDTTLNESMDVSMTSVTEETKESTEAGGEDSDAANRRLRHTNKNKRKAAADEVRKERAKKAKADAEKTKKQKEWEKLLDSIEKKKDELKECEASINELDDDLRETRVHRSTVLGKDRFLNKYYWFEHNGMPFGGVPNSSTAEYGYANGRIWVQGPDEHELQPNMEEPALSQDLHRLGFTIPQRKEKEEGATHLANASEWGYYDDPEEISALLEWLDVRGHRERLLMKELQAFGERITEYMGILKGHKSKAEDPKEDDEDEDLPRVSTRNKAHAEKDATKDRCLHWTNSIMREEYGYNHIEEYEPPKKTTKTKATKAKAKGKR